MFCSAKAPLSRTLSECLDQWSTGRGARFEAIRPAQLGQQLEHAHWQFFFVPPELRAKAFGFGRARALARALRKIWARADLAGLNTVEIARITTKELPGIQFACIEARLRHIQQGLVLTPEKQGTKPSGTTGLRPPSPQSARGDRPLPRHANALHAYPPHFRRNFNS